MKQSVACQAGAIVDQQIANDALAGEEAAGVVEGVGADGQAGNEQHLPAGVQALEEFGHLAGEEFRAEKVHSDGQVRAVLLEGADGEEDQGFVQVELLDFEPGHFGEIADHRRASFRRPVR